MSVGLREDSDDVREQWTYSVELPKTHDWPEFIIFGLDATDGNSFIASAIDECEADGSVHRAGQKLFENSPGFSAVFAERNDVPFSYSNSANWFAPARRRRQILWPDENGLFPGDPRCDSTATDFQMPEEAS